MFKYTRIEYQQNPPSFGGSWESGREVAVCFSKSPKKALRWQGATSYRHEGVQGVPIMEVRRFEKDGKLLWERWD